MSGELPAGWRWTTLGDISESIRNGIFTKRPDSDGIGTPILRISAVRDGRVNLHDRKWVRDLDPAVADRFAVAEGDLLFTRYNGSRELVGICGRVGPQGQTIIHPDKLIRVVPDRAVVDDRFLNLQMQAPAIRRHLGPRIRTTAGQSGIAGGDIKSIPVVLPRLDEQQRIVVVLEDHLSRLDAANDYFGTTVRRAGHWRRAAVDDVIARAGSGSCRLGDLIERVEAGKSFGGSAPPAAEGQWGVIRVSAMTWGEFRAAENKAVPADQVDERYEIRSGDVLVSRANTTEYVGAPVFVKQTRPQLLLSDKSLRLVPRQGVDPRWLVQVLGTRAVRRQISSLATGTKDSMRNISQANLLSVSVPVASEGRQTVAALAADAVGEQAHRLTSTVSATGRRTAALRRRLLAAAFAGHL